MTKEDDWKWYAGICEDEYPYGPFETRESAIEAAAEFEIGIIFVIEACRGSEEADDEGMAEFAEWRNMEAVDLSGKEAAE